MSTTVSYKGATIATVSNDTKTLLTEGKYLEDDLTLTDVSGGGAVLTTKNISANGTYNASSDSADGYSQVTVAVPASAVDTGTKSITSNGTHDVVGYASASVAVPNSYSASDEGKVVSNGALVAQTAHADVTPTTSDQTIDTTLNNSLKVKGDADLVAGNIKKDVEIFGVTGSYEGGGGVEDGLRQGLYAVGGNGLKNATLAESMLFPVLNNVGEHGMQSVSGLKTLVMPSLVSTGNYPVSDSPDVETIDIGSTFTKSSLGTYYWAGNEKLKTLILRSSTLHGIGSTNCFQQTPFASGGSGGTLYVPSAMISSYQSASNWSTILGYANNSIQAIEGSYYETHYADGTVIS